MTPIRLLTPNSMTEVCPKIMEKCVWKFPEKWSTQRDSLRVYKDTYSFIASVIVTEKMIFRSHFVLRIKHFLAQIALKGQSPSQTLFF